MMLYVVDEMVNLSLNSYIIKRFSVAVARSLIAVILIAGINQLYIALNWAGNHLSS